MWLKRIGEVARKSIQSVAFLSLFKGFDDITFEICKKKNLCAAWFEGIIKEFKLVVFTNLNDLATIFFAKKVTGSFTRPIQY